MRKMNCQQLHKSGQMISSDIQSFKITADNIYQIENKTLWTGSDSIKIRIYFPNNKKNNPILFNIHGGALVAGDLETHDNICRRLSKSTQAVVVALDYRKAS
jgi:acetyl esterase